MAFKDGIGVQEELRVEMISLPSKHELVLEFNRFLTEDEWREVVEKARTLPYVKGLRAESK